MTCGDIYKEYSEALARSSEKTEKLKELFGRFGFQPGDLKTLQFSVDTEYENYQENNVWKQRFLGYRSCHVTKIEFASDNDRLGKILYALANSEAQPQFDISYTVIDPEAAKNELLGRAVADAFAKAGVLAAAAGQELGKILSIDYSWNEIRFDARPVNGLMESKAMGGAADSCSYDIDIEPDDIKVSDTVTVVWEIG
jgi:uncharacterized protein YggE